MNIGDVIELEQLLKIAKYQSTIELTAGDKGVIEHVFSHQGKKYVVAPMPYPSEYFGPTYKIEREHGK